MIVVGRNNHLINPLSLKSHICQIIGQTLNITVKTNTITMKMQCLKEGVVQSLLTSKSKTRKKFLSLKISKKLRMQMSITIKSKKWERNVHVYTVWIKTAHGCTIKFWRFEPNWSQTASKSLWPNEKQTLAKNNLLCKYAND